MTKLFFTIVVVGLVFPTSGYGLHPVSEEQIVDIDQSKNYVNGTTTGDSDLEVLSSQITLPHVSIVVKAASNKTRQIWPNGRIPYVIDKSLAADSYFIYMGMRVYEMNACVRFVKRTNQENYVTFVSGSRCLFIESNGCGRLQVSLRIPTSGLYSGCTDLGSVLHVLGHVVGLINEHQRSDRDNYIFVKMENAIDDREQLFEKKLQFEIDRQTYDFTSVMHQGNYFLSKNNKPTLMAKSGQHLKDVREKSELSRTDVRSIRKLYNCE